MKLKPVDHFNNHCQQVTKRPAETAHLRHGPDQKDLHDARHIVQGDSGAAALLRRQEEPNKQNNK